MPSDARFLDLEEYAEPHHLLHCSMRRAARISTDGNGLEEHAKPHLLRSVDRAGPGRGGGQRAMHAACGPLCRKGCAAGRCSASSCASGSAAGDSSSRMRRSGLSGNGLSGNGLSGNGLSENGVGWKRDHLVRRKVVLLPADHKRACWQVLASRRRFRHLRPNPLKRTSQQPLTRGGALRAHSACAQLRPAGCSGPCCMPMADGRRPRYAAGCTAAHARSPAPTTLCGVNRRTRLVAKGRAASPGCRTRSTPTSQSSPSTRRFGTRTSTLPAQHSTASASIVASGGAPQQQRASGRADGTGR